MPGFSRGASHHFCRVGRGGAEFDAVRLDPSTHRKFQIDSSAGYSVGRFKNQPRKRPMPNESRQR